MNLIYPSSGTALRRNGYNFGDERIIDFGKVHTPELTINF